MAKADLTAALTQVLDIAPQALGIPDIDSGIGLMHTLFAFEDIYDPTISEKDNGKEAYELLKILCVEGTGGQAIKRLVR